MCGEAAQERMRGGSKCVRAEQRKLRSVMTRVWRGVREAAFCVVGDIAGIEKAAAVGDEGPSRAALRSKAAASSLGRRPLLICDAFPTHRGFQFPRFLSHSNKRRLSTNSTASALARRVAFGFAECGWRRLTPPPHAAPPLKGRGGAPRASPVLC